MIHRAGWIAKYSMEIPLEAINDVRFEQGVIDRIIGAGTLVVSVRVARPAGRGSRTSATPRRSRRRSTTRAS